MKVGVISDTHGFLDPKISKLFAGVGHILHAGDIGDAFIAFELEQIAPLTVVLGNTDSGFAVQGNRGRGTRGAEISRPSHRQSARAAEKLKARIARERPDVVVFGHTHKRFCETIGGILFFNPGYSGKPKFGVERGAAILHCDEKEIRHEFVPL